LKYKATTGLIVRSTVATTASPDVTGGRGTLSPSALRAVMLEASCAGTATLIASVMNDKARALKRTHAALSKRRKLIVITTVTFSTKAFPDLGPMPDADATKGGTRISKRREGAVQA